MQFGKVDICGINTATLPVLKEADNMQLLQKSKTGDKQARNKIVEGNLRLVLSVVQRFSNRGENPDDLFQVGCIGLMKAVDNFDLTQNVRFSTYAVPMIIGEIRRYLRDNNAVRVSRSVRDTAYRAMQVRERLQNENNKEPTVEEIAKELELPKESVALALEAIVEPISLYEPIYSDGGDPVYVVDQVGGGDEEKDWIDEIVLRDEIADLSEREKRILYLRFMLGKTQTEVANEIGVSQAQVSRLEKGVMEKILR
ncbi:MAG: RNA polymerase sporulation sigma factor SigG [Ruminococcaceae bacterium]|nr:RNA polymerase sporulation sigma factor SigG [Oscillospiraceae bacterium]